MSRRHVRVLGAAIGVVVVAVTVTACAPKLAGGPDMVGPIDVAVSGSTAYAALPPGAKSVAVIAVDTAPRAVDDVFVGSLFPGEGRTDLAIVGFDATGTLWSLSTNPSCAGWAATRAPDGSGLVVALNSDARVEDGIVAESTFASGFDTATGAERWAAKPVIGPVVTNGVLFTGAQKAVLSAEPEETQTLIPADGAALRLPAGWSTASVVHEHFGVVLVIQDDRIAAVDSASGGLIWQGSAPGGFLPGSSAGQALAFRNANVPDGLSVFNLSTGELVAQSAHGVHAVASADGAQTILVTGRGPKQNVSLISAQGTHWSHHLSEPTGLRPVSLGADRVYLDASGERIVLAGADGTELHRGSFAVPVAVTTSGFGLIPTGDPREYEMVHLASD